MSRRQGAIDNGWGVVLLLLVSSLIAAACGSGGLPSDLIQVREGHTATLLENGQVLLVGGTGGQVATPELFDPATGWSPAASTSQALDYHTAARLADGRVLVSGGSFFNSDVRRPLAKADVYDPATNTWTQTGSMRDMRERHTATLLADGRVLVVGGNGESTPDGAEPSGIGQLSAELYDPSTGTWSDAASMAEPRTDHAAALLADGRVFVIGGESSGGSAEVYDPSGDSWSSAAALTEEDVGFTATLLSDGRVLVLGGVAQEQDEEQEPEDRFMVGIYDPSTDSWFMAAAPTDFDRDGHTATLLNDGRVLLAGGSGIAEVYSPVSNSWTLAGELIKRRDGHTATLLTDSTVLIAGGGSDNNLHSLTEVFDPAADSWTPAAGR